MGRAIAAALGLTGSGRHFIQGKDASGQPLCVTWCIGHLVQSAEPDAYDPALKQWRLSQLPFLPETFRYQAAASTNDQWQAVRELLQRDDVTEVVNATDAGREGQLIFHLVYDLAGAKQPVQRLWTSSLTDDAIRTAWRGMKSDATYNGLTDAARCRQEADWLVGINCTRAQTLVARSNGGQGVYSIGRVQTPTLAILVHREKDIRDFVPKDFWTLQATFRPVERTETYVGRWFRTEDGKDIERFDKEPDARAMAERLAGKPAVVVSVEGRTDKRKPELLYDLTALQKEANRRFKWSAEHTLEVAQELYEAKLLSYPRTNSRHLTQDDAKKAPQWLAALDCGPYAGFVAEVRAMGGGKPPALGKRFVDDKEVEDHSAIVVTEKAPPVGADGRLNLGADQARLYDLVARRLLAAWFPDRLEAKTTIVTRVEDQNFKTTGAVIKDPGWTRVDPLLGKDKSDGGDDQTTLPVLKKGEKADVLEMAPKAGKTSPPKPMTEADLLTAMQGAGKELDDEALRGAMKDSGLGTPATRANMIETLVKRAYVERKTERKNTVLRPTEKGIALIDSIQVEDLTSPLLTGRWEAAMEEIRRGKHQRSAFMADIREFVTGLVQRIAGSDVRVSDAVATGPGAVLGKCQRCGSNLLHAEWQGEHYAKCSAVRDAKCRVSYAIDANGKWTVRCPACTGPMSGRGQCVWCGRSQEPLPEGRPPWPPVSKCDQCRRVVRVVWSAKTSQWCLRCDPCDAWIQVPDAASVPPAPAPGPCPKCAMPMAAMWSARKSRWFVACEPCAVAAWEQK